MKLSFSGQDAKYADSLAEDEGDDDDEENAAGEDGNARRSTDGGSTADDTGVPIAVSGGGIRSAAVAGAPFSALNSAICPQHLVDKEFQSADNSEYRCRVCLVKFLLYSLDQFLLESGRFFRWDEFGFRVEVEDGPEQCSSKILSVPFKMDPQHRYLLYYSISFAWVGWLSAIILLIWMKLQTEMDRPPWIHAQSSGGGADLG